MVRVPATMTVQSQTGTPYPDLPVYVFSGATYTGYNDTTDVNGEVSFALPPGDYHFRADLNGTLFWSDIQNGAPYPDLPVYVFLGETYTGFNDISDVNGQAVFTLPAGDYRFRSDYDGTQILSGGVNHCTISGCLDATVEIPGWREAPIALVELSSGHNAT